MKKSGVMAGLLVSGVLMGGTVAAEPDWRHDRGNRHEGNYRDNDRDHNRYDRRNHRSWDRDRDYRNRTNIDINIGYRYPAYTVHRHPRYVDRRVSSRWLWDHGYRPYYYRGRTLVIYPDRSWERAPAERVYWMESNNPPPQQQRAQQEYCREYTSEADVNGRIQQVYGTACMQPDGTWRIVE